MTAARGPAPAPPGSVGPQVALRATGLLAAFNAAGVLSAADVHVATRLGRLAGERDDVVLLAAALTVRAVREGSVCLDLASAPDLAADAAPEEGPAVLLPAATLTWPDLDAWRRAVQASPLVAAGADGPDDRPLRWSNGLLYLDRYWRDERRIRADVRRRLAEPMTVEASALAAAALRLFPAPDDSRQRLAAAACAVSRLTVLTGGPGTGKTTTVARLLAVLQAAAGPGLRVALAAPTGKAAARLGEAVQAEVARLDADDRTRVGRPPATTVHRLLGWRPGSSTRFRHDADRRLPHDLVVVDETSMMSLPLIARLLEALRPDARLLLVGDPDQLASVDAGAVLADLVAMPPVAAGPPAALHAVVPGDVPSDAAGAARLRNGVVRLEKVHRHGGAIADLAAAVRDARPDVALTVLRNGDPGAEDGVELVEPRAERPTEADLADLRRDATAAGRALVEAAREGDAGAALRALDSHRLLLAHRSGPYGAARWASQVEAWIAEEAGLDRARGPWYVGRPLLVTANDRATGLFNGDTGVVVDDGAGGLVACFGDPDDPREVRPHRLPAVETVYATTIHRAQGSQFARVSVILPPVTSPLLTRELLYTAVTRATRRVRLIGPEPAIRAALVRQVRRASGLRAPG